MMILSILSFLVIGSVAGLMAGLLGISGGIITVPCLALIFRLASFPQAHIMQLAIGTSLASMIFSGLSAAYAHHLKEAVIWDIVKAMIPGIICGCIIGAFLAHELSSIILSFFFGIFALMLGFYFYRKKSSIKTGQKKISKSRFAFLGLGISSLASVLGIGGGIITVPILTAHRYPEKKAIGTSAATGIAISFIGALSYLYFGMQEIELEYSIGYLYLPAFICVSIGGIIAAPFGVKLAHALPEQKVRKFFGLFLMVSGILMMFN